MKIQEIKKRHDRVITLAEHRADMGSIMDAVAKTMADIPDLIEEREKLRTALQSICDVYSSECGISSCDRLLTCDECRRLAMIALQGDKT
jgi:uncharacterized protein (DUF3084 family)